MAHPLPHISVCICTFKRPALLKRLLEELSRQTTDDLFTYSAVVADNDRQESGRATVLEFGRGSALEVVYCLEPEQNIALARNRALAGARGELIAFIDDDEFPAPDWLLRLFQACQTPGVAGVLGPVKPFFEEPPPNWLLRGRFCERPSFPTGTKLSGRDTRTGNVLFWRKILQGIKEPFRRQFGSGSEDTDFFIRMMGRGEVFTWCEEAAVYELVPRERWRRSYWLRRALLRGQSHKHLAGVGGIVKSMAALAAYGLLLPVLAPLSPLSGRPLFFQYLIRACDHAGKLLGVAGISPLGDKYLHG